MKKVINALAMATLSLFIIGCSTTPRAGSVVFDGIAKIRCTEEIKMYGVTFTEEKNGLTLRMYGNGGKLLLSQHALKDSNDEVLFERYDGVNAMRVHQVIDNGKPMILGVFTEITCPNFQKGVLIANIKR